MGAPSGAARREARTEGVRRTVVVRQMGAGPCRSPVLDSNPLLSRFFPTMTIPRIFDELGAKLSEIAASSPARDIEKNARALLGSAFGKLDLVTREEFDAQRDLLAHARQRLAELEARVAALEAELGTRAPGSTEGGLG